jgi:hypothetical protein
VNCSGEINLAARVAAITETSPVEKTAETPLWKNNELPLDY